MISIILGGIRSDAGLNSSKTLDDATSVTQNRDIENDPARQGSVDTLLGVDENSTISASTAKFFVDGIV
jgi:hypothetical protein